MFERFTDRARRVVVLAQEFAREEGTDYIGTEHLLQGLLDGGGIAAKALEDLGLTTAKLGEALALVRTKGFASSQKMESTARFAWTVRAKKVMEYSLREALQLGHNYIGTEHILLGIIRLGEGVAVEALVNLGVYNNIRKAVIDTLTASRPPAATAAAPPPQTHREKTKRYATLAVTSGKVITADTYAILAVAEAILSLKEDT